MKVFISQPMRDKTDEEIKAYRNLIQDMLGKECGYAEDIEVIDSFIENAPRDVQPLWYLGKSLELLSMADLAFFGEDWEKYRGCKIEHEACIAYGIPMRHWQ